jgi:hypothetical protein
MHLKMLSRSAVICFLVASTGLGQTTIHVPADYSTIQGAINAAARGDTVLVSPGSYSENLDFRGKAITVTSGATDYAQAAATILNGVGSGPTVRFHTGETRATVLNGFTIQNGQMTALDVEASPTISNNAIVNNLNCAVVVTGLIASPLIQNNRIAGTRIGPKGNQLCSVQAHGIFSGIAINVSSGTDVVLSGNLIEDNNGAEQLAQQEPRSMRFSAAHSRSGIIRFGIM